jgi:hypothetical protein
MVAFASLNGVNPMQRDDNLKLMDNDRSIR